MTFTRSRFLFPLFISLVLIAAAMPWAVSILRTPLHSDLIWLYESFARLITGQTMAESIYEPNPPLSLFTYALPYYATAITGLPPHITIFSYVMGLLTLAALIVNYVVTRLTGPGLYAPWIVTAGFVVSQTIMTTSQYGERDHLIGIVLVPFVLMQYAITKNIQISKKLQWPVFLAGAIIILLKPHHGIVPFFMIVHRMIRQKNLSFIKDADFLSLAMMVLAYGVILLTTFADYRTVIFPDVVRLYLTERSPEALKLTALLSIPGAVVLGAAPILRDRVRYINVITLLALAALASLIPYFVQGKGFFYHLFPVFGFFIPSAFLLLAGLLEKELKNAKATAVITLAALIGISYAVFPVNMRLPGYQDYQAMPLTKLVGESCQGVENCSFMMFNDSMGITHETAYVTGLIHGSRFPSFWFLPAMLAMDKAVPGSADNLRHAYGGRVAEDLARYKPQTLIIGRFGKEGESFFDFPAYWAVSESFRTAWENYRHTGTIDIDYGDYYPGTIADKGRPETYDIYRRIKADDQ